MKPGDIVEITIAPQIKKVLYFNVRHKLKELKEKIKEQIGEDTEKNMLSYKEKKGIEETLGRKKLLSKRNSLKIIEKKQ